MLPSGGAHGAGPLHSLGGEEREPLGQAQGQEPVEELAQVPPEPLTHKGVDHRVDTTVGISDHLCHLDGQVQLSALPTLISEKDILECRDKQSQVVGCPKEEEDDHDDKDQADSSGLLLIGPFE